MKSKILIFSATYNESENINTFLRSLDELNLNANVLIIDDNSPDKTWEIIQNYSKDKKNIHLIIREKKEGLDTAHKMAYEYAVEKLRSFNNLTIIGHSNEKGAILTFTLDNIHPNDIAMILDQQNVAIRTGHHCAQPLLKKLNLNSTARVSFGIYNNKADVDVPAKPNPSFLAVFTSAISVQEESSHSSTTATRTVCCPVQVIIEALVPPPPVPVLPVFKSATSVHEEPSYCSHSS